ncbi:PD-(D/E)XK nuclease family protein [Flavobacterium rakeshii]|uniref:PDDEXK-like family protein n=1 Tax=Flavobacterium rakeshii TaxID=1038845 RepID=UPI002E7AF1AA|nr:PD-(D/E)XK nuclease family protein [Flavobacterium rakeshii]MEE1898676.1 PD-(D/E)XK nuclease family protein [Flavobacterium rakeshii]
MFRICGVNHYENTHSAILAELLDPNGTHGLKHILLESFIGNLGEYFTIEKFNSKTARVKIEHSSEEGRVDILIDDNENRAIIIENKIYAKDQPEQLIRYDRFAQMYENGYQLLYLTLFGNDASEQSSQNVCYLAISYNEHIINWLEKCLSIASRSLIVRETIIQYINHLKQLTNQDMDIKNKEEITEVLSKIENLRAAQAIYQNYSATYNCLAEKYFNPKMEEFISQQGLFYHYESSEERYIKFHITSPKWQGKYWIGFTFESNRCHYGLCNNFNEFRLSDENRIKLHENLNNLSVFSRKESNWWPFYASIPNLTIDNWEHDIIKSDNFLNDCINKIKKLLKALESIDISV